MDKPGQPRIHQQINMRSQKEQKRNGMFLELVKLEQTICTLRKSFSEMGLRGDKEWGRLKEGKV